MSECCVLPHPGTPPTCPRNGHPTRPVGRKTVESVIRPPIHRFPACAGHTQRLSAADLSAARRWDEISELRRNIEPWFNVVEEV